MNNELPIPKRYVMDKGFNRCQPGFFFLFTDQEVAEFVNNLAPVGEVEHMRKSHYAVHIDKRYGYDQSSYEQSVAWIEDQLMAEYGDSEKPARPQFDIDSKT